MFRPLWPLVGTILSLLVATDALAGVLTLSNGDSLKGSLKGIFPTEVVWQSPILGELHIDKSAVINIQAADEMKVRGKPVACQVQGMTRQDVSFQCADGDLQIVPLLTLKQVVPFTGVSTTQFATNGDLRASGWKQEGNLNSAYWEFATRLNVRQGDWRHALNVTFAQQSTRTLPQQTGSEVVRNSRAEGVYSLDWFILPQWYMANQLTARSDDNFNIQEEYNIASGLGYQFWERDSTALSAELGVEHSRLYRRFNPPEREPEINTYGRLAMNYRYKWLSGISIYHRNSFKHALNPPPSDELRRRWELRTQSGVNFPIGFGVSSDLGVEWNYVNHAQDLNPNASRDDIIYRFGVNYGW